MVALLAVNSIEKKLEMQASIIVGNYEFYYACGLLSAVTTLEATADTQPVELKEKVVAALATFSPAEEDARNAYLCKLLERYRPTEDYDEQMAYLFTWGAMGKEPEA